METIKKYFPLLTDSQVDMFSRMGEIYGRWNSIINVISRKDMEHFYTRHVLHSLAISRVVQFADGTRVMDVGTGGGFPGIPLAVMFPNVEFTLVDSIGKKTKVAGGVAHELGLKNVRVINARVESIDELFDFVVSRAVTSMDTFVPWVKGKFSKLNRNSLPNGILYLKGGDLSEELKNFPQSEIFDIYPDFCEDFFQTKRVVYLSIH